MSAHTLSTNMRDLAIVVSRLGSFRTAWCSGYGSPQVRLDTDSFVGVEATTDISDPQCLLVDSRRYDFKDYSDSMFFMMFFDF